MIVYLLFALTIIIFFIAFSMMDIQQTNDIQGVHGVVKGEYALNNLLNYEVIDPNIGSKVTMAYLLSNIELYEEKETILDVFQKNSEYILGSFVRGNNNALSVYENTNKRTYARLQLFMTSEGEEDRIYEGYIPKGNSGNFDIWAEYAQVGMKCYAGYGGAACSQRDATMRGYNRFIPLVQSGKHESLKVELIIVIGDIPDLDKETISGSDRGGVT